MKSTKPIYQIIGGQYFQQDREMKMTQLKGTSLVKPVFLFLLLLLLLFLVESSFPLMGRSSCKAEAMRLIPIQETRWMMRKKMLVAFDNFDGCGCYSDDDCKNNPGCGSFCSKAAVIGIYM